MARRLRLRSSARAAAAAAALAALAALAARFAAAEGVPFEEQARDALKWALDVRADAVREFALEIEASYDSFRRSGSKTSGCSAPSACAAALPPEAVCDAEYGATEGCECAGRRVDHTKGVIKIPGEDYVNELTKPGAKHAVCFMDGLETTVQRIRDAESDASLKTMYIGTTAGAFWQHPGILWPRDTEGCDANYDPRVRPWYVSGASGPKNVVLILDTSGSMGRNDRLGNMQEAAKLVVSGLTHADSVAVVTFSSDAASENNYLVPATASYRSKISSWIEKTKAAGSTNYTGALASAINIVRRSESSDRITGCRTAYVFLSDGEPNEFEDGRMSDIQAQIARLRAEGDDSGPEEKVFWFGLGTGGDQAEEVLADLACQSSSVYTPVPDFDPRGLAQSLAGYQHFFSAELGYLNENAPAYTPKVSFSEPYTSIPDIWGQVITAVAPVYTYDGATFNGCTDYDWATPWCATTDCGTCDGLTSSGCWDECDVSNTPKGLVESELQARSLDDSCAEMSLDDCALLALREASWDGYRSSPCGSQRCGTGARLTPSNPFEGVSGWSDFESTGYSSTDNKKDVCDDPSQSTAICGTCDAVVMQPPCTNEACVEGARRREESRYVDPILQMCGHAKFPADGDDPYYGEPVRGRDDDDDDGPITDDEGGKSKQIPIYYFAPVVALASAVFILHSRAKRRRAAATRGQQGPSSFQAGMGAGAPPASQPHGLQMFGRQAPSPGYVTAPPVYVDGAGAQMQPGSYVVAAPGGPPPPPVVAAAPGGYMSTTQPVVYAPQGASPLPPQPPPGY